MNLANYMLVMAGSPSAGYLTSLQWRLRPPSVVVVSVAGRTYARLHIHHLHERRSYQIIKDCRPGPTDLIVSGYQ